MNRDQIYIDLAIKILGIIGADDLKNPRMLEKLKLYYAKIDDADIQKDILDYCDENEISYCFSYVKATKNHIVTFTYGNISKTIEDEELLDAMAIGVLKIYEERYKNIFRI